MITLLSTWNLGVAFGFVALGVFVSYKLFSFPDITTDGSFTLGAVVTTALLVKGVDPALATLAGMAAGAAAGACTGMLHAILGIEPLLSGILMMTALASVNLVVLGRSNVPLSGVTTLLDKAEVALLPMANLLGFTDAAAAEAAKLCFMLLAASVAVLLL